MHLNYCCPRSSAALLAALVCFFLSSLVSVTALPAKTKRRNRDTPRSDRFVEHDDKPQKASGDFCQDLQDYRKMVESDLDNGLPQSSPHGGTRITSNFIQDQDLLQELTNFELWDACARADTMWLDWNAAPQNVWERLAINIWEHHPLVENNNTQFAGYEYWCNIKPPALYDPIALDWHVDKDEAHFEDTLETLKQPVFGAVYYGYPHQIRGGYLEILPRADYITTQDPEIYLKRNSYEEVERIAPEYNRMIQFNVSKWHRVSQIHSGFRFVLAVNIWKDQRTQTTRHGEHVEMTSKTERKIEEGQEEKQPTQCSSQ